MVSVTPEESVKIQETGEWGNAWIAWSLRRRLWVGLSMQLMDTVTFGPLGT